MLSKRYLIRGIIIILLGIFLPTGCAEKKVVYSDKEIITHNLRDFFTRLKLGDKTALYYNEFPYLREDIDLEGFLNNRLIKAYSVDTLAAMQIDSVQIIDSLVSGHRYALAYVEMEYILADSSRSINKIRLPWYEVDGNWIKPSTSSMTKQDEFEEEMRIYWEAVKEKQREDSIDQATKGASGK